MRKMFVLALLAACATEGDFEDDTPLEVTDDDLIADDELDQAIGGKEDSALSYVAVARLVKTAGVACTGERIATAVAVAKAESSFRPQITNTVGNTHGIDRGLFQINSYWHPEVSATCALSASCNTRAAVRISRKATRWVEWWTWKNNKHKPFMASARSAQATVCAE
jgi:hypothetical protein